MKKAKHIQLLISFVFPRGRMFHRPLRIWNTCPWWQYSTDMKKSCFRTFTTICRPVNVLVLENDIDQELTIAVI
jgi:hypothetical protein